MTAVELVFGLILASWLVLSILTQLPTRWFGERLGRILQPGSSTLMCLIPRWSFFAPNPRDSDTHLVFRGGRSREEISLWSEVVVVAPLGRWSFIWNPLHREKKAYCDHVMLLMQQWIALRKKYPIEDCEKMIQVSYSYLMFLNIVSHMARADNANVVQFGLVNTDGPHGGHALPIFVSVIHDVGPWD